MSSQMSAQMSSIDGERRVAEELSGFGLDVAGGVCERLVVYCQLLLRWSERINLTAARTMEGLISDHLPDSIAIARRLQDRAGDRVGNRAGGTSVVDVGSGGGLPAIPLALLRQESRYTLIEATAKKAAFLRTAARELGIDGRVEVQHRRLGPGELAGAFDVATSRAMVAPSAWLGLGLGLVRKGGAVFCLASEALEHELPAGLELVHQASYRSHRWVAELKRST